LCTNLAFQIVRFLDLLVIAASCSAPNAVSFVIADFPSGVSATARRKSTTATVVPPLACTRNIPGITAQSPIELSLSSSSPLSKANFTP
jgi:hypothetical protein